MSRLRSAAALAALVATLGAMAACAPGVRDGAPGPLPAPAATTAPAVSRPGATALAALEQLPVRGRAPMTGYSRARFGQAWSDAAGDSAWTRNGCDTRNDLLARDLVDTTVEPNGCVVVAGVLGYEPYSGATDRPYDKHDDDPATDLDADHVVALGNAWATGAQQIGEGQRAALANDPINLMLVDPSLNRQKGDGDLATWLPPNKRFRCSYAARQVRVKAAYHLWVTAPEKAAMERVLSSCPDEPLDQPEPPARPLGSRGGPFGGGASGADDPSYATCAAVRAAGAAPIRRGDPGYARHLDRDGDGVGCE